MAASHFSPTDVQQEIAAAFSDNADRIGAAETLHALLIEAGARFDEPRIGELVAKVARRQAEFGAAVVSEFRRGRFWPATVLVRSMLETLVWIAWPLASAHDNEQRRRLIRLVLAGYRVARNKHVPIPDDVEALFRSVTGEAARRPPTFEDVLGQLDALEKAEGGKAFWTSHARHYDFASEFAHPRATAVLGDIEDPRPPESVGVNALTYGHQYLVLAGASCAILAEMEDLKAAIEQRFATVAQLQHDERDRVARST